MRWLKFPYLLSAFEICAKKIINNIFILLDYGVTSYVLLNYTLFFKYLNYIVLVICYKYLFQIRKLKIN